MSWRYCSDCGAELDEPTNREVLVEGYHCPACGVSNEPLKSVNDVILELLERVEQLESQIGERDE